MRFTLYLVTLLLFTTLLPHAARAEKHDEREVAALVEIATSESEPEARRAKAIRELEFTDVRTQMSPLRKLLREERSVDIRLAAACVLVALGDRKTPRDLLLVTAYEGSRTPNCSRSDVALALGRLGDPAAEMHLAKALKEDPPADEPQ